jgi:hypothetical protein
MQTNTHVEEHNAWDDLKSMPLSEVEARLGWSPDGLAQTEVERRLAQYGCRREVNGRPYFPAAAPCRAGA